MLWRNEIKDRLGEGLESLNFNNILVENNNSMYFSSSHSLLGQDIVSVRVVEVFQPPVSVLVQSQ